MSFATPTSHRMDTLSPPSKCQRFFSPSQTDVSMTTRSVFGIKNNKGFLLYSPLSSSSPLHPVSLEKEFALVPSQCFTPSCTPIHTPSSSPLSSPPRVDRLRLFDTPHTPKSLIKRASANDMIPNVISMNNSLGVIQSSSYSMRFYKLFLFIASLLNIYQTSNFTYCSVWP